jgi:hypothetical protein
VLKISCMRFYARLDTSHHGPPHQFRDTGAVADSLRDIHSAMMCIFVVSRSWGLLDVPAGEAIEDSSPANVEATQWVLYLSVSWYLLLRTSRTAQLRCAGAPSACTTFVLWLPEVHLPVALADHVRGNLGSGCLQADVATCGATTHTH